VRPVHRDERLHGADAVPLRCGIAADLRRRFEYIACHLAAGPMLLQQYCDEVDKLVRLAKTWKQEVLFGLFVIVLDEILHQLGGIRDRRGIKILIA
jgi:hypothetical protein